MRNSKSAKIPVYNGCIWPSPSRRRGCYPLASLSPKVQPRRPRASVISALIWVNAPTNDASFGNFALHHAFDMRIDVADRKSRFGIENWGRRSCTRREV